MWLPSEHSDRSESTAMMGPLTLLPDLSDPAMRGASQRLASAGSIAELVQEIANCSLVLYPSADAAAVYTADPSGAAWHPCADCTRTQAPCGWQTLRADGALADLALADGTAVILTEEHLVSQVVSEGGAALLMAPLHAGEAPLGMIIVRSREAPAPLRDASSGLRALATLASHALERVLAAEGCGGASHRPERTLEALRQGVAVVDGDRIIRQVNPALGAMLGLAPDAPPLPCPLDGEDCPERLRTLLDPCRVPALGPYVVSVEGGKGPVSLEVLPSPLEGRGGTAYVVLDVTAERVAAEGRSAFISQIAHELRAPIQHIMGFSSIISDVSDLSEETLHRFLGHINDESRRLARLVDDLAELTRIDNGRFSIQPQNVRVDALLGDLVARHTPSAASKDQAITLRLPEEPVSTESDPARLEQVVGNLMENAIKFVPPGGRIDVSLDACTDCLMIHVADTGPGIPAAAVGHVFDRFYQAPQVEGQSRKGMGLGLYISREIARGMGGDITVESRAGHGCAFTVRLPRQ